MKVVLPSSVRSDQADDSPRWSPRAHPGQSMEAAEPDIHIVHYQCPGSGALVADVRRSHVPSSAGRGGLHLRRPATSVAHRR